MAIDLTRNISHYVAYANNPKSVTLTGYTPTQNQVAEDLACISGKTSGTTCGVIKDTYSCATFENSGEFCGVKASYTANRGDSGGTVFSFNGNLLGVHKGGTSAEWYTGISRIISNLNIHPVVGGY